MALGQKRLLRRDDLGQREGRGHQRLDLAAFDGGDEGGEHLRLEDRAAQQAQILEVERAQVEIDDRVGYGPATA